MKKASWLLIFILIGAMIAGCDAVGNVLPIKAQPTPTPMPPLAPANQYASAVIQASFQAPANLVSSQPVYISHNTLSGSLIDRQAQEIIPARRSGNTIKLPALVNIHNILSGLLPGILP